MFLHRKLDRLRGKLFRLIHVVGLVQSRKKLTLCCKYRLTLKNIAFILTWGHLVEHSMGSGARPYLSLRPHIIFTRTQREQMSNVEPTYALPYEELLCAGRVYILYIYTVVYCNTHARTHTHTHTRAHTHTAPPS